MEAWDYVINTAMLGTDKPMPGKTEMPDGVADIAVMIDAAEAWDKEEKFLKKAAVIYNYRQCGFSPAEKQDLPVTIAQAEVKPYCSPVAARVLKDILAEENTSLLEMWLMLCDRNNSLLLPEDLVTVLDKASADKSLRHLVIVCSGNRGIWLSKLNPAWSYFTALTDEELWQTGKPEERVEVLKRLRDTNAALAREWLQQTWPQETAASKVELLKTLKVNSSAADLPLLEGLLTEKGQKVKDEVLALLKLIPGSSIIKQYEDVLRQSVILKKEKALLGMMTKISIQQKLPADIDESIFKSGIEKLAGQKSNITDEEHIIQQLINAVPPSFWEKQYDANPQQVIEYFNKYAPNNITPLGLAVSRFKQTEWVPYLLEQPVFFADFLEIMVPVDQQKYVARFFRSNPKSAVHYALKLSTEWNGNLATALIGEMTNHPYEYNRAFFSKNIKFIPVGIIDQIEKIEPKDANLQNTWEKTRTYLIKLLGLKQQTLQAFNV